MIRETFLLFFLLATSSTFGQNWQQYNSIAGKFRIDTPAPLTEKTDSIETEVGKLAYHTFFYQDDEKEGDNLFYMVNYVDYPDGSVHSDSTEILADFFETTIQSAVESVEGELLYSSETTWKDFPGRVWKITYLENKVAIKSRAFLVNNRFYLIQVIAFKEKSLNKSGEDFFNSFQIFL